MGDGSPIIIKRITRPNAAIGIVKTIIIGIIVALLPFQMTGDDRPHLPHIGCIGVIFEMPHQFIDVVQVHIVVMHLVVTVRITADIAVAIHLRSPFFLSPCHIQRGILRRMRNRWRHICHLTSSIGVEMTFGTVPPSQHICQIASTPSSQRRPPAYRTMKPRHSVPSTVSCCYNGRAQRIKERIGSVEHDLTTVVFNTLFGSLHKLTERWPVHILELQTIRHHLGKSPLLPCYLQTLKHFPVTFEAARLICANVSIAMQSFLAYTRNNSFYFR